MSDALQYAKRIGALAPLRLEGAEANPDGHCDE